MTGALWGVCAQVQRELLCSGVVTFPYTLLLSI